MSTSFHSPLSAWVRGLEFDKWITHIDLDAQTFTGHLPPAACDAILSAQRGVDPRYVSPLASEAASANHEFPWEAGNQLAGTTGVDGPGVSTTGEGIYDEPMPLDPEQQLRAWWFTQAEEEIDMTVAKAIEYGADDLIEIGRQMADVMHQRGPVSTCAELAELGVYFYLIGKIARWTSAIRRGDRPSDDTLLDIGVYVRMAQRIRQAGGWPGTETE